MKKHTNKIAVICTAVLLMLAVGLVSCASTPSETDGNPIVALGDSLTNGTNRQITEDSSDPSLRDQAYPAVLAKKLNVEVKNISQDSITLQAVVNAGEYVWDAAKNDYVWAPNTLLAQTIAANPQAVIVCLGANDYSYTYNPDTKQAGFVAMDYYVNGPIKAAYLKLVDALTEANPKVKIFIADGFPSPNTDIANQIFLARFYALNPAYDVVGEKYPNKKVSTMTDAELETEIRYAFSFWRTMQRDVVKKERPNVDIRFIGCLYGDGDYVWKNNLGSIDVGYKTFYYPDFANYYSYVTAMYTVPPTKESAAYMADLQHPNTAGYAKVADYVFKAIKPRLPKSAIK